MGLPFNSSDAIQYQLCININAEQLAIGFAHLKNDIYHEGPDFSFEQENEHQKADELSQILKQDVFKHGYGEITAAISKTRSTLVPMAIFNESNAKDLFQFNFSESPKQIDHNRLAELDIANVYEFPDWIKRKIVIALPRVRFFHEVSILLKSIFNQPIYKPKVHLFIENHFFYVFITHKNKLTFYNVFAIENFDDSIYHLLFALKQNNIEQESADVYIMKKAESYTDWKERAQTYFKTPIKEHEHIKDYELIHQRLCV